MCSGTKIPHGDIHTLGGATLGYHTRNSPRTQSRREAGRSTTDKGVKKVKPAQMGRPKATKVKDSPSAYAQKLEIARQFCALVIGDQAIRSMIGQLQQKDTGVTDQLLEWDVVSERLGVIFGGKYANDRTSLAVAILRAHHAHLVSVERAKRRAEHESAARRVHDQKAPYVKKRTGRAA